MKRGIELIILSLVFALLLILLFPPAFAPFWHTQSVLLNETGTTFVNTSYNPAGFSYLYNLK